VFLIDSKTIEPITTPKSMNTPQIIPARWLANPAADHAAQAAHAEPVKHIDSVAELVPREQGVPNRFLEIVWH
jgi:hypothetical protein